MNISLIACSFLSIFISFIILFGELYLYLIHCNINFSYELMVYFRFFSKKSLSNVWSCISDTWLSLIFLYFLSTKYFLCFRFLQLIIFSIMNNNHLRNIITFKKVHTVNCFKSWWYCWQLNYICVIFAAIYSYF